MISNHIYDLENCPVIVADYVRRVNDLRVIVGIGCIVDVSFFEGILDYIHHLKHESGNRVDYLRGIDEIMRGIRR